MKRHPHRGIILHGRPTSLRLEREFWEFLREIAIERRMTVTALIEAIDQMNLFLIRSAEAGWRPNQFPRQL